LAGAATLSAIGIAVVQARASINVVATVATVSKVLAGGIATLTSTATISAVPTRIRNITVTLAGVLATLTVGEDLKFDPFRIFVVPADTRTVKIAQETRKHTPNSETRVNTIQDETRSHTVRSETRQVEVQPDLKLTDVFGVRDTRN
jgi:hypothetical protein